MRNQGQIIFAVLLIVVGILFLAGNLLNINVWALCWPLGLIVLGVFLVVRPRFAPAGAHVEMKLIGDIQREGPWQVSDEEIWIGIGDLDLDMTQADIPAGETRLRVYGLIGDVDVRLPAGAEVAVSSMAFVTDAKIRGEKREQFLTPLHWSSPGYQTAERRVSIETMFFINDMKVR